MIKAIHHPTINQCKELLGKDDIIFDHSERILCVGVAKDDRGNIVGCITTTNQQNSNYQNVTRNVIVLSKGDCNGIVASPPREYFIHFEGYSEGKKTRRKK